MPSVHSIRFSFSFPCGSKEWTNLSRLQTLELPCTILHYDCPAQGAFLSLRDLMAEMISSFSSGAVLT